MVQEKIKLMLLTLIEDKKSLRQFYKNGYFSYFDEDCQGEVAICNKAIISFLENSNDITSVVATASFHNSGILIYKLFGQNYLYKQFGRNPSTSIDTNMIHLRNRSEVIKDISTIRKYCTKAQEKISSISDKSSDIIKLKPSLFQPHHQISIQDVTVLLKNTLDKLDQTRQLDEVDQISDLDK